MKSAPNLFAAQAIWIVKTWKGVYLTGLIRGQKGASKDIRVISGCYIPFQNWVW